jgi:hypothetical protein
MQVMRIPLRKLNSNLRITLPRSFTRELGLTAGDYVDLVQDNGNFKLRFVKVEPPSVSVEQMELAE